MRKIFVLTILAASMTACSDSTKKMIVLSKGEPEVNTDAKTIKTKDGAGHHEKMVVLGGGTFVFKLSTPAGEADVELKEKGLYVINAKNDTIVGSYQRYIEASKANAVITQEDLARRIDSLSLLVEGKNVSAVNRNFFLPPNSAARISGNVKAEVVGPYHQMRSAEKKDGEEPEIYRFYSTKEIRETIAKLQALTVSKAQ
jgi:hypothetical protein